jgi:NitT/TauT family transport system substrate-binding protein
LRDHARLARPEARVATFFPDVPKDILARALGRYRDAGLWSRETRMIPQGFERLGQSFVSGGSLARMPRYDDCVEPILNEIRPRP